MAESFRLAKPELWSLKWPGMPHALPPQCRVPEQILPGNSNVSGARDKKHKAHTTMSAQPRGRRKNSKTSLSASLPTLNHKATRRFAPQTGATLHQQAGGLDRHASHKAQRFSQHVSPSKKATPSTGMPSGFSQVLIGCLLRSACPRSSCHDPEIQMVAHFSKVPNKISSAV